MGTEKTKYIRPEFGEEETSEILPSSLDQTLQRSRKLTLVRILALCQLLLVFPGSHMQDLLKQWGDPAGPICIIRNCGGGKVIFPLPFWVLVWDHCNKRQINKRKSNRTLLTCLPLLYVDDTQGKTSNSERGLRIPAYYGTGERLGRGRKWVWLNGSLLPYDLSFLWKFLKKKRKDHFVAFLHSCF